MRDRQWLKLNSQGNWAMQRYTIQAGLIAMDLRLWPVLIMSVELNVSASKRLRERRVVYVRDTLSDCVLFYPWKSGLFYIYESQDFFFAPVNLFSRELRGHFTMVSMLSQGGSWAMLTVRTPASVL